MMVVMMMMDDNDDLPKLGMFARRRGYFLKSGYEPVLEGLSRRAASSNAADAESICVTGDTIGDRGGVGAAVTSSEIVCVAIVRD